MNDIYSSPTSALEEELELELELASRWSRLFAIMVDGIIAMVFSVPLMMYLGHWDMMKDGVAPSAKENLFLGVLGMVFYVIVHGYFLAKNGQSIGKLLLGIRIVGMDNRLLPLSNLLAKRYLPVMAVGFIPIIGQYLATIESLFIFRKDKRCIHDFIANTKVVKV